MKYKIYALLFVAVLTLIVAMIIISAFMSVLSQAGAL